MIARLLVRWVLLVIPVVLIGIHPPLAPPIPSASVAPSSATAQPFVSGPRQTLPVPVHDEATCAFCQAAAFAPHSEGAADALPLFSGAEQRETLSLDGSLTHHQS